LQKEAANSSSSKLAPVPEEISSPTVSPNVRPNSSSTTSSKLAPVPEESSSNISSPNVRSASHELAQAGQASSRHQQEKKQAKVLRNAKDEAVKALAIAESALAIAQKQYNQANEILTLAQEAYDEQTQREAGALREAERTKVSALIIHDLL
jgi:hypothetical protein